MPVAAAEWATSSVAVIAAAMVVVATKSKQATLDFKAGH
jgi:hypothetical protein